MFDPKHTKPVFQLLKPSTGVARLGDLVTIHTPSTSAPPELRWVCTTCGLIEPYFVAPIGKYVRRSCACEKRAKQEAQDAEHFQAWKVEQARRTYGRWLGARWGNPAVTRELSKKTLENFQPDRDPGALAVARAFVESVAGGGNASRNIAFIGEYGSGKTHLEAAILNALRERKVRSLFVSAPILFKAYNDALRHDDDAEGILRQMYQSPVVVIDDIDKAAHTESREDNYFSIFDERYKAGKPTIISTNRWEMLPEYIGEAAYSRLTAKCREVEMIGGNFRVEEDEDDAY